MSVMLPSWNLTSTYSGEDNGQQPAAILSTTWLPRCAESTDAQSRQDARTNGQFALIYIVVVILFYSSAMILLVIKHLVRKKADTTAINYYDTHFRRSNISSTYSTIYAYHDV